MIFAGDSHGQTFDLVRSRDNEVVYTGIIPHGEVDPLSGQVLSVGDFTVFDEPGTYYIHTDIVGQSYPFGIAGDTYENLFLGMLKNFSNAGMQESPEGVCDMGFGMHAVMYALQCNGALFEAAYQHLDQDGQDKQLVTQLLYMGKWLSSRQKSDGSMYDNYEATAAFCGIMAMSRDMFGRYEENVARSTSRWLMRRGGGSHSSHVRRKVRRRLRFMRRLRSLRRMAGRDTKPLRNSSFGKSQKIIPVTVLFFMACCHISVRKKAPTGIFAHIL